MASAANLSPLPTLFGVSLATPGARMKHFPWITIPTLADSQHAAASKTRPATCQ
jgi:hypothetical protein